MTDHQRLRATQLEQVIRSQGRTNRWLAGRVGLSESYLGRIIKGVFPVREEKAAQIARELGVPLFLVFEVTNVTNNVADMVLSDLEVAS